MKRAKISISLHQQALCKHHTDQFLSSLFPSLLFSLQSLHCLFFICVYLYSRLCNAASWDVIDRLLPEWKGSTQHWECQTWSTESTAGLPSARNIQAYWSKSRAEPQRWLRNWSNSYHQRLKEMGLFRLRIRRFRGISSTWINTQLEGMKKRQMIIGKMLSLAQLEQEVWAALISRGPFHPKWFCDSMTKQQRSTNFSKSECICELRHSKSCLMPCFHEITTWSYSKLRPTKDWNKRIMKMFRARYSEKRRQTIKSKSMQNLLS